VAGVSAIIETPSRRWTDLFTVPTLMFQVLYCFFVIDHDDDDDHDLRKMLHLNVTQNPKRVGLRYNCVKPGHMTSRNDS